jgi:hypothetical protein
VSVCDGSSVTVARSVAKFTAASATLGSFFNPFSTRRAQEAQDIPPIWRLSEAEGALAFWGAAATASGADLGAGGVCDAVITLTILN